MTDKHDAVYWVHIGPRENEPDNRVHMMVGEESENINLTMCGTDAGTDPREVLPNTTTVGDLCVYCLSEFVWERKEEARLLGDPLYIG